MSIYALFLNPYVLVLYILIAFIIYKKIYPIIRNNYIFFKKYEDFEVLHRDIDCNYSPSIVSMLLDNELEIKDIVADLMNLYANNYLIVNKTSDKYNITVNSDKSNINELSYCDRYLINTIILKKDNFHFNVWKSSVERKYDSLDFTKKLKSISLTTYAIIILSVSLITIILSFIFLHQIGMSLFYGLITATVSTLTLSSFSIIRGKDKIYKLYLNNKGKAELKKWLRFKKFIKEYTLISEKNIQDVVLYEKYIPYAVALGINKNYKDTIYSVFNETEIKKLLEDSKIDLNLYNDTASDAKNDTYYYIRQMKKF